MKVHNVFKHMARPIISLFRRGWFELRTTTARINRRPILILGNQKSGTSAIAALLGEMSGLSVTIDLTKANRIANYDSLLRGELSFSEFVDMNRLDFSRQIVKEPNLTIFHKDLIEYFHESKMVFIIRDPRDNIRSILNRLMIPGNRRQLDMEHQAEITPAWELVIDGRWFGLTGKNYIEMLAERWNFIADVYLQNKEKMILVRYEDFVRDKIGKIRQLAHSLGLDKMYDISGRVDIQFQPRGERDVKLQDFFGQDNLALIESTCGKRMKLFDYLVRLKRIQPTLAK